MGVNKHSIDEISHKKKEVLESLTKEQLIEMYLVQEKKADILEEDNRSPLSVYDKYKESLEHITRLERRIEEIKIHNLKIEGDLKDFETADTITLEMKDSSDKVRSSISISSTNKQKMWVNYNKFDPKTNKVFIDKISVPYIGTIIFYYYVEQPTEVYMALRTVDNKYRYFMMSPQVNKQLWSAIMKVNNRLDIIGKYSPNAMKRRIEKLQRELNDNR